MIKYVAEIGVNHLGNSKLGFKLVKAAAASGADAVSMQILDDKDYDYKKPWRRRIKKDFYIKVIKFLKKKKIKFGFGIYDVNAINEFKGVKVDFWKIISYCFYKDELIKEALKTKKDVYISTGVSSLQEIKKRSKKFPKAKFIHTTLSKNISSNLFAIKALKKSLKKNISYGLHSEVLEVIPAAIALKPETIFFYIKNDNKLFYPDNEHAVNVDKIKEKIKIWKFIEFSLGNGLKRKLKAPSWVFE